MFVGSLGIAGLGITLTFNYIAVKMALDSQKDTEVALDYARKSAEAMDNAALAMQAVATEGRTANEISRNIANSQLKAYVGIETVQIIMPRHHAEHLDVVSVEREIVITLKNYGQTPAKSVRLSNGTKLIYKGDSVPIFGETPYETGHDILPKATMRVHIPLKLSPQEHADVIATRSAIFLYTRLRYDDAFGGGVGSNRTYWSNGNLYKADRMIDYLNNVSG